MARSVAIYPDRPSPLPTQETNRLMAVATADKPKRKDIPKDANLCEHCTAKCCRYFALPIETPEDFSDFEYIRWYLLHDRATIFTEGEDWYLLVHTTCRHLREDYRCGIYETRPQICRDYTTDDCEYEDDWTYERYFELPQQVAEYTEAVLPRRKRHGIRSRKPDPLSILSERP